MKEKIKESVTLAAFGLLFVAAAASLYFGASEEIYIDMMEETAGLHAKTLTQQLAAVATMLVSLFGFAKSKGGKSS